MRAKAEAEAEAALGDRGIKVPSCPCSFSCPCLSEAELSRLGPDESAKTVMVEGSRGICPAKYIKESASTFACAYGPMHSGAHSDMLRTWST